MIIIVKVSWSGVWGQSPPED